MNTLSKITRKFVRKQYFKIKAWVSWVRLDVGHVFSPSLVPSLVKVWDEGRYFCLIIAKRATFILTLMFLFTQSYTQRGIHFDALLSSIILDYFLYISCVLVRQSDNEQFYFVTSDWVIICIKEWSLMIINHKPTMSGFHCSFPG